MAALVRLPNAPPLRELADRSTWEGRERVEWGKAIGCNGESEDEEVGGEGEVEGRKWGKKVGEKKDRPKRWHREYRG